MKPFLYVNRWRQAFSLQHNLAMLFTPIGNRQPQYWPELDGLRALAIIYLMIFHAFQLRLYTLSAAEKTDVLTAMPWWQRWIAFGDKGVDMFFVLSGFLIGYMLMKEFRLAGAINVSRFIRRRFMRLSPLYYTLILVFFVLAAPWVEGEYYLFNIFYINNLLPLGKQYIPYSWSLAIEMQFYMAMVLYLPLFFRLPFKLLQLCVLLLLSIVARYWVLEADHQLQLSVVDLFSGDWRSINHYVASLYTQLHTRIGPLIIGVIAAYIALLSPSALQRFSLNYSVYIVPCLLLGLWLIVAMPLFTFPVGEGALLFFHVIHRHLFSLLFAALMLLLLFGRRSGMLSKVLSASAMTVIARLSYAVFLGHVPVLLGFNDFLSARLADLSFFLSVNALLLIALPFIFVAAVLAHIAIELPFMRLRNQEGEKDKKKAA